MFSSKNNVPTSANFVSILDVEGQVWGVLKTRQFLWSSNVYRPLKLSIETTLMLPTVLCSEPRDKVFYRFLLFISVGSRENSVRRSSDQLAKHGVQENLKYRWEKVVFSRRCLIESNGSFSSRIRAKKKWIFKRAICSIFSRIKVRIQS